MWIDWHSGDYYGFSGEDGRFAYPGRILPRSSHGLPNQENKRHGVVDEQEEQEEQDGRDG